MITICKGKEESNSILFKIREDGNIKFKRIPFQNYFYIDYMNKESAMVFCGKYIDKLEYINSEEKDYFTHCKVLLKNNFWRRKCARELNDNGIKTYESDINSFKRFLIDNSGVELNHSGLLKVYMDIETYDYGPYKKDSMDKTIASYPILSVALKDEEGNEKYIVNHGLDGEEFKEFKELGKTYLDSNYNNLRKLIKKNEKVLIQKLIQGEKVLLKEYYDYVKNYDMVIAYNGNKFDFTYIKQRMELHEMNYYDLMNNDIDYYVIFRKDSFMSLKRWGLNEVSKVVLKHKLKEEGFDSSEITKIDWKKKTKCRKFFDMFLFYPEMFKEYNIQDCNLMMMLENELHFMNIHSLQSELCHCPIEDTVYNSRMCDYLMLNERKKIGMISKDKPSEDTVRIRSLTIPGGGYTYCNFPGFWKNLICLDFLSHYPTTMINFNISPEKYEKDIMPDLKRIFNDEEISYINYCVDSAKAFIDKKGDFKKKKYEKAIEEERIKRKLDYNMYDLMWKFVENDNVDYIRKQYPNYVVTPSDINFDTRGWVVHPHRLFKNDEIGLVSRKEKDILFKRIEVKEKIKKLYKEGDPNNEIPGLNFMQNALKILINSFYGYFGFRRSRDYLFAIPDCITTSCRFITKKTMIESRNIGLIPVFGDTDSCYFIQKDGKEINIKETEGFYFDFYKDWFKQFGTIVEFEKEHPLTGELTKVCHTTEFNFEKSLKTCIDIKKKKYFYFTPDNKLKMKGVSALKSDTLKTAADISIELAKSVLSESFNEEEWKIKIMDLKNKAYNYELSDEEIFKFVSITKPIDSYGGPVIDGKTGKPKIKKNGEVQYTGVPAHIKVAKSMVEAGEMVDVGDKIGYVIIEHKPRISAISIKEYKQNKRYDAEYYWKAIESSILEVLEVVCPNDVYDYFSDCWSHSKRVQGRLRQELSERFLNYKRIDIFGDMKKYCPMEIGDKKC